MGTELNLRDRKWTVIQPLNADGGGFGDLYVVHDQTGFEGVAKLVEKVAGAERELFIGTAISAAQYPNVMPVEDDGEHDNNWVLVMPRAVKSLAAHLADTGGVLDVDEAVDVLKDIATALAAIDGELVHRDVKPPNILLFNGSWCLTDFGIARYADATTANDTRKGFLSRPYAAPEQWNFQRATSFTDVYALGCVGYEMLTGNPPFHGPDFRTQHLQDTPPELQVGTIRLRVLIEECLYKPAGSRPTPAGLLKKLEKIADEPSGSGLAKLAEANLYAVKRKTAQQAQASAEEQKRELRAQLHVTACSAFERISNEIVEAVNDHAPSAILGDPRTGMTMSPRPGLFSAQLNGARFGIAKPMEASSSADLPFTVVSESAVMLYLAKPVNGWEGRSHSLWYCDAEEKDRFAWYETAFMVSPLIPRNYPIEPFFRTARDARAALGPAMDVEQVAWPFEELDRADLSEFINRWLGWFGDAANGKLSRPSMMPEKPPAGTWRKR